MISLIMADSGVNILFTVLIIIAVIGVSVLLFFGIRKDTRKLRKKAQEENILAYDSFVATVDKVILRARRNAKIKLFQVDIRDYDNVIKLVGEEQFRTLYKEFTTILANIQPWGIRLGTKKVDSLLVLLKVDYSVDVDQVCGLIINSLAKTYSLSEGLNVEIKVNVGAVGFPECGADNADAIMKDLEIAIVDSRRKGENRYSVYNAQLGNSQTEEYKYYLEIREAMKKKEFILYYQPIVDTNNNEVSGTETLMRWNHSVKGVLPPSDFLYVMEQTGDIYWVGLWCFEQMLIQASKWKVNYEQRFSIYFNVSERQLLNPELADEFKKIIKRYKVEPQYIGIDISDIQLYTTSEIAKANIDKLKEFGLEICIDNYGAGFTSPTLLEELPMKTIKMERKFWSSMEQSNMIAHIVEMLIDYAREKSLKVIAMGVETKEEIDMLRSHGINYMQGYAFDKPKDARDFIGDVVFTPWAYLEKDAK